MTKKALLFHPDSTNKKSGSRCFNNTNRGEIGIGNYQSKISYFWNNRCNPYITSGYVNYSFLNPNLVPLATRFRGLRYLLMGLLYNHEIPCRDFKLSTQSINIYKVQSYSTLQEYMKSCSYILVMYCNK